MPIRIIYRWLNRLKASTIIKQQISSESIDAAETRRIIKSSEAWTPTSLFHRGDSSYILVDLDILIEYLKYNDISDYRYITNDFDCEDFSYALMGDVTKWDSRLAFGIVWVKQPAGTYHALNFCIAEDKQLYFVEPQINEIFIPEGYEITWMTM
jgi:hypothetical protein